MWLNIILTVFIARQLAAENGCLVKDISKTVPNAKQFELYSPTPITASDVINHGDLVIFNCESGFVTDKVLDTSYLFRCTNGIFNDTFHASDLLCRSIDQKNTFIKPVSNLELNSRLFKCDRKGLKVYQVNTKKNVNLRHLYTVCIDEEEMTTKFVFQPKHVPYEFSKKKAKTARSWGLDYFGKTAKEKFEFAEGYDYLAQVPIVRRILYKSYSEQHKFPYFFNRGHLAPAGDFPDVDDKQATCQYLNIAPQWEKFNSGSWVKVEDEARKLVTNNPLEWEIYTGTYGYIRTHEGPLYAYFKTDEFGILKKYIRIPKLFWKVVHNVMNKNLTRVYVGINDPRLISEKYFNDRYEICKPLGEGKDPKLVGSPAKGFFYRCTLESFLENAFEEENEVEDNDDSPGGTYNSSSYFFPYLDLINVSFLVFNLLWVIQISGFL